VVVDDDGLAGVGRGIVGDDGFGEGLMSRRQRRHNAVVITDAAPSFEDELRSRQRRYAALMAVHIVGFALAGVLYYVAWWLGLVLMIATGALPWIAVVTANDNTPRAVRPGHLLRDGAASGPDGAPAQLADRHPAPRAVTAAPTSRRRDS
jgi:hypothetical protein